MLDEKEALARMIKAAGTGRAVELGITEATGGFFLDDIGAREPSPPFDNSSVDGYAVAEPLAAGAVLRVAGEQPAGKDRGLAVHQGETTRIFTGAPVPRGAVAVVMQEDVERENGHIRLLEPVETGENIRRAGSDFGPGSLLAGKGGEITPAGAALLASQGIHKIPVVKTPRIGILTTGDELVPPGQERQPGQIVETNALMLAGLLQNSGLGRPECRHARDDVHDLEQKAEDLFRSSDFLITVGGVSVGEHDLVRPVLAKLGVVEEFWKIRLKPGKPLAFGTRDHGGHRTVVFGLPGNPVSAFISTLAFVLPVIRSWRGAMGREAFRSVPATLAVPLSNDGDRPHYLRGILDENGVWTPSGLQRSDALRSLATANSLVRLPEHISLPRGAAVEALFW